MADICRYRADIEPLWFSDIGLTSSLYRPDVGLISLTTSGRHRAHVQTWSLPDISRHLPISARYNFRHQADVVADICRYRADIWPIVLCYLGKYLVPRHLSLVEKPMRYLKTITTVKFGFKKPVKYKYLVPKLLSFVKKPI